MPLYDYECPQCGVFTAARSINDRDQRTRCDHCGRLAIRLVSAPMLNLMSSTRRDALFRNEKSRHEPAVSSHACGRGCGCGAPRRGRKKTAPLVRDAGMLGRLGASRSSTRPWMLGH